MIKQGLTGKLSREGQKKATESCRKWVIAPKTLVFSPAAFPGVGAFRGSDSHVYIDFFKAYL